MRCSAMWAQAAVAATAARTTNVLIDAASITGAAHATIAGPITSRPSDPYRRAADTALRSTPRAVIVMPPSTQATSKRPCAEQRGASRLMGLDPSLQEMGPTLLVRGTRPGHRCLNARALPDAGPSGT